MEINRLPMPTVNLFSGGKHAGAQVALQDVLLVPCGAAGMEKAMEQVCGVYHAAASICGRNYGSRALVADEGGLAPPFPNTTTMLEDAVKAIETAGLVPGTDVALAVDVASSHFHTEDGYSIDGRTLATEEMIAQLAEWRRKFPIISIEDGLAEEDWQGWTKLTNRLGSTTRIMGDDLLCTNPERIRRAIGCAAANALLLKVNQIGTLTEAQEARQLAVQAGWAVTVSARSGETEDDWLADLAVGWGGDHIKIGSVTRSERLAKYNRLLVISSEEPWGFG
jgi:enolase